MTARFFAFAFALVLPAFASAAVTEVVKLAPQRLAAADVTALSAEPARVQIRAGEAGQLLITAKMKDGFEVDATDPAALLLSRAQALGARLVLVAQKS